MRDMLGPYELDSIITGDARELAQAIPDNSIDLAFADPPYWVGYNYGHQSDKDMDWIDPVWLVSELRRIAKVVCVATGMRCRHLYPVPDWELGWFKFGSTGRSGLAGFNIWEPIAVYGKPRRPFYQDAINLPQWNNLTRDGAFHACPKPLRLLEWIVDGMTEAQGVVFDPVSGSGTTCVAAKRLGRRFLGFEIDPATAERARQRVHDTQPPLFEPEAYTMPIEVLTCDA